MDPQDIDGILNSMTLEDSKELRRRLTKNIKSIRKSKNLSLTVYVQAEFRDKFEIAKEWAYEKGLTKKMSNWAFAKFALINTIKMINDEIERERIATTEIEDRANLLLEPTMA